MIATQPYTSTQGAAPAAPAPLPVLWADRPQADRLAIAYQRGELWALEPLYDALRPMIEYELYREGRRAAALGRPLPIERADMTQEAWCILADLALLWRPAGGEFGAYVRASFGWALSRYIKQNSHARRSKHVTVESLPHEFAADLAAAQVGEDGRDFAERAAWRQMLAELPDRQRAMLVLTAVRGLGVAEAARRLGLSHDAAAWALRHARRALGAAIEHDAPIRPQVTAESAAECLLRALAADPESRRRLPGRARAFRAAGITQRQYLPAMRVLVAAGIVVGRAHRQPGHLDYAAASAWLGETLAPPPVDAPPPAADRHPRPKREPRERRMGWKPRPQPERRPRPEHRPPPPKRPAAAPLPPCTLGHDAGLEALRAAFGIALFRAGRTATGVEMYLCAIARYRAWLAATGLPDTAESLDGRAIGGTIQAFGADLVAEGRRAQTVRSYTCVVRAWAAWVAAR